MRRFGETREVREVEKRFENCPLAKSCSATKMEEGDYVRANLSAVFKMPEEFYDMPLKRKNQ